LPCMKPQSSLDPILISNNAEKLTAKMKYAIMEDRQPVAQPVERCSKGILILDHLHASLSISNATR